MATTLQAVKLLNGSLHESDLRGGTIILRGVLHQDTLKNLLFDDYQREALPLASLRKLTNALKEGNTLPDIEIGMRGEKCREVEGNWFLNNECFVIDGQQRVNACVNFLQLNPGAKVFLGATIHFDTTKEWERERFRILNTDRVKVSPNVLLRNYRMDHPAIAKLYAMTTSSSDAFCIGNRVCWGQKMRRGDLFTALNILKVVILLHRHISPGSDTGIQRISDSADRLMDRIGTTQFRDNIKTFFDLVDDCWGIRIVQYRELSAHLHAGFLLMLARYLSNHLDFWKGPNNHRLTIDADIRRKMAQFPLSDPAIAPLTSSAGASRHVLLALFAKHVNSGRRTKKLQPRIEAMEEGLLEDSE